MSLLEVKHVKKVYTTRFMGAKVVALKDMNFHVETGQFVAIMEKAGLVRRLCLSTQAALDKPTEGEVLLNGKNIVQIPDRSMAAFRRQSLGFVFQDFNLLDTFSLKIIFTCHWSYQI